jgi:polysaccharide pyruvyl transferase WcaK-like protein
LRILIYANGIGPLFSEKNRERTANALRMADAVSLRDPHSFEFVKSIFPKAPVRLTFDPAILTEKKAFSVPCENYFVVAPKKSSPASTDTLVRLIRTLAQKTGMSPFFVSMYDKQDMAFVKSVALRTDGIVCRPQDAGECIGLFAKARLVISSRLHGLVYATAAACPMMAYSDDEKLFSYLDYIGLGTGSAVACGISVNASADAAIGQAMTILEKSEHCRETLRLGLNEWQALAKKELREAILLFEKDCLP